MANLLKKKNIKILGAIIVVFVIALIVRFWKLSQYPVSLSMDEVSVGYNAYSILKTGRDEFGELLPLAFKSVGDYKPPVDIYLTVPSIALFGLNEFAVRFHVALIAALSSILFIFFIRSMRLSWLSAIMTGLWVALVSWGVHFSRGSFAGLTAMILTTLGVWLFIKWTKDKNKLQLIGSAIAFSVAVWGYHAERVFVPLLVLVLFYIYKDRIKFTKPETKKHIVYFALVVLVFAIPFLNLTFFTPAIKERAISTSIIREQSLTGILHIEGYENVKELIFDNNAYLIFRHWLGKYFNYFDLRLWFWKGMQFTPPGYSGLGFLFLVDLPIILMGIYSLIRSRNKEIRKLALFWFFAGPLPASLTMNEQHPLRALVWFPFFALLMASGFEFIAAKLKRPKMLALYVVVLFINFVYFFDIYTNHSPRFFSEYWQYGYKDIAIHACENKDKYDNVFISESFGVKSDITGLPHLYVLFYCKYDPVEYLDTRTTENIRIKRPYWKQDRYEYPNSLFIAAPWDFPIEEVPEEMIVKKIYFKSGELGFIFVDTSKGNAK
ncbi:phospholipid carrier-dependent glycosyltransferase [Patescibacteria group bacterium]|nr:phospholipid carrier-dependent glycosyltransferase [Patescibacteria group bacterium]MBU1844841.1 phospholipid carrier-dependent glycosyltransferase [Patescibacteria group bacterium]